MGVTEGEVVHRLSAVRGVDGRTEGEVMLLHVGAIDIRILQAIPSVVRRERRAKGEAAKVVLGTSVEREFVGAVGVIVTA